MYCLPDMYEVQDRSLADIQYVLNPTFTGSAGRCPGAAHCGMCVGGQHASCLRERPTPPWLWRCPLPSPCPASPACAAEDVSKLDGGVSWARALDGSEYMPGLVGLNNMKQNDYANVVVQALIRVWPIRWVVAGWAARRRCVHCCTEGPRALTRTQHPIPHTTCSQRLLLAPRELRLVPVAAGAAVWGAGAQGVEPARLQGPGLATRVHAGTRQLAAGTQQLARSSWQLPCAAWHGGRSSCCLGGKAALGLTWAAAALANLDSDSDGPLPGSSTYRPRCCSPLCRLRHLLIPELAHLPPRRRSCLPAASA